jgi:hypothetical protein
MKQLDWGPNTSAPYSKTGVTVASAIPLHCFYSCAIEFLVFYGVTWFKLEFKFKSSPLNFI